MEFLLFSHEGFCTVHSRIQQNVNTYPGSAHSMSTQHWLPQGLLALGQSQYSKTLHTPAYPGPISRLVTSRTGIKTRNILMLDLLNADTGTEGRFILEATVEKTSLKARSHGAIFSECDCVESDFRALWLLSYLLSDKDVSLLDDNHLWCVVSEHSKGKLDAKVKATFSFKSLWQILKHLGPF